MKPPAKTHTLGIHAALGKNVGHFRATWLILAVLTLAVVLRWESRAQPRYWTPQNPPAAEYRFRLKIGLDGLEGRGTIRLTNSTHRPLTVLALEGPSSTPLPEVTVDGRRFGGPAPDPSNLRL